MVSIGNNYLEPRTSCLESIDSSCPQTPVSPQLPFSSVYSFDSRNNADSLLATPNSQPTSVSGTPLYINVPTEEPVFRDESPRNSAYLYLTEKYDKSYPPPLNLSSSDYEFNREQFSPNDLQYITLELGSRPSSPSAKPPIVEESRSPGYTTIDFQKTWALGQSTKPNLENDRGCTRRTRHNSTLYEVQSAYR